MENPTLIFTDIESDNELANRWGCLSVAQEKVIVVQWPRKLELFERRQILLYNWAKLVEELSRSQREKICNNSKGLGVYLSDIKSLHGLHITLVFNLKTLAAAAATATAASAAAVAAGGGDDDEGTNDNKIGLPDSV